MRNILSRLLEITEDYLMVSNFMKQPFACKLSLLRELSLRKQQKLFEKTEAEAESILSNNTAKDGQYYYDRFELENIRRTNSLRQKSKLSVNNEQFLPGISDYLTKAFIINLLQTNTFLYNANFNVFLNTHEPVFLEGFERFVMENMDKLGDVVYVQYYYNAFKLASTKDEKHFFALKKIADEHYDELTPVDKRDIFTLLTNYCYFKINEGALNYRKEHFTLYRENISRGHYKGERKFLSHIMYLNVIVTGLDAGETAWIKDFIENYRKELDRDNFDNSYFFARALYNYHLQNYSNAIDEAAKVKTDDLSYKHQLKSLYLKIYFDMNESEPFYSHIDSYRHFLTNQKHIPAQTREVISSYVTYAKRLFDVKNKTADTDFDLHKLKKDITHNISMINRSWLLEKITEIQKVK
jgi:hypothetical protein